jgi:hypothetical protein
MIIAPGLVMTVGMQDIHTPDLDSLSSEQRHDVRLPKKDEWAQLPNLQLESEVVRHRLFCITLP